MLCAPALMLTSLPATLYVHGRRTSHLAPGVYAGLEIKHGDAAHLHAVHARQLTMAWCMHAQVTDAGLAHIAHHWRLVSLDLSGCVQLTPEGLQHLKGAALDVWLRKAIIFHLSNM